MTAHYDSYDYPSYWKNRDYEHQSEVLAIQKLLHNSKVKKVLDVGAGFGRLTPFYSEFADEVVLLEPSVNHLNVAKESLSSINKKINYLHGELKNVEKLVPNASLDLVIMVRVMHHIKDPEKALAILSKALKKDGLLLIEFANKIHGKAVFKNMCRGNFTFPLDIYPEDIRCIENKKNKSICFYNYHPDSIFEALKKNKIEVIKKLSVSNVRLPIVKKTLPFSWLMKLEDSLQESLSGLNFGPSIFVLAKKTA